MDNMKGKALGRYHIIEPLGEGGMATVYNAFDGNLERNVAIKVIRTDMGGDENFLRRFQREAKALAQLDHPFILKVLDYGEQDGIPYLVMPFVSSGTLKQRMGKPLSAAEAARILAPIARALEYAHQQGIIHRDVKPANILINQTGTPFLSDFGIARMLESREATQLTAAGVGIGTPDYMAPEQWLGTSDARTDVYSLGVVFYEMITGRRPYTADTPAAVLLKHMQDPLPRPSEFVAGLPDAAEQVIFQALAKDPAARFTGMGQFAAALERMAVETGLAFTSAPESLPTLVTQGGAASRPFSGPQAQPGARPAPPAPVTPTPEAKKTGWRVVAIVGGLVVVLAILCLVGGASVLALNFNNLRQSLPGRGAAPTPTLAEATVAAVNTQPALAPAATRTTAVLEPAGAPTLAAATPYALATKTLAPLTKIEGMPEDIPLLLNNNGDLITQDSSEMSLYMYTTALSLAEAGAFFQDEMKRQGWVVDSTTTMTAQDSVFYSYAKDGRMVMLNLVAVDYGLGPQTTVQVMIQKEVP